MLSREFEINPLASSSPREWDALIEAVGPASLLVVIESRMSHPLKRECAAEDILQESLMHAWRDRSACQWRGVRSFRSWLLTIIDNRLREAADRMMAQKRGGGRQPVSAGGGPPDAFTAFSDWGPVGSTTPSRVAIFREQATAMQAAVAKLPEELREVVRLRLFEQLGIEEIAGQLGIGEAAVRHRFRKGAEIYHRFLRDVLASGGSMPRNDAASRESNSSS
ncbi:MAG TPA: sigma-70 family RNA polymerase sigma factor [Phycisphaerae bacterium]|nr:sigma-70 family RNA polymerase sigma factor [Phycisphaerae bacterium]